MILFLYETKYRFGAINLLKISSQSNIFNELTLNHLEVTHTVKKQMEIQAQRCCEITVINNFKTHINARNRRHFFFEILKRKYTGRYLNPSGF